VWYIIFTKIFVDFLIDRYKGGEWLTSEELRFLANTSELLNSCIDKDYMQKAVNSLDPDIIDNVIKDFLELGHFDLLNSRILCAVSEKYQLNDAFP